MFAPRTIKSEAPLLITIAFNFVIAVICTLAVNLIGCLLRERGYASLDMHMSPEQRYFNVAYRTLAPIVFWCPLACLASIASPQYISQLAWVSLVFYWVLRLILTALCNPSSLEPAGIVARFLVCILIGLYFSNFLIGNDLTIFIPNQNDVVFQFWLIAATTSLAVVIGIGGHTKVDYEKHYYEVEAIAEPLLPTRFREDIALKVLFYSIGMAETHYRGKYLRKIERLAARFKLAKSTGIMQVKSEIPLSDAESATASFPIIESIWDEYLEKSCCIRTKADFLSTPQYYEYRTVPMLHEMKEDAKALYARYNGSDQIDISAFIDTAQRKVLQAQYLRPLKNHKTRVRKEN